MAGVNDIVDSIAQIKAMAEAIKRQQVLATAKGIQRVQAANTQNFNAPSGGSSGGGGGAAPVSTLASLPQTPAIKDLIAKGILKEGMPMEQIQAILSISGIAGQVPIDIEAMKKQLNADYAATTGDIEGAGQAWMQQLYGANFAPGGPNAAAFQNDPLFSSYAGGLAQMGETSDQMQATDLAWFDKQQQLYNDYYNGLMASVANGGGVAAGGGSGGGGGGGGHHGGGGGGGGGSSNDGTLGFGDTTTKVTGSEKFSRVASENVSEQSPGNYQRVLDAMPPGQEVQDFVTEFMDIHGNDSDNGLEAGRELQKELAGIVGGYDELEKLNLVWDSNAPSLYQQQVDDYLTHTGQIRGDDPATTDVIEPWHRDPAITDEQLGTYQSDPNYSTTYGPESRLARLARQSLDPMLMPGATVPVINNVADMLSRIAKIRAQNQGTTDPLATVTEDTPNPEPPGTPGGVEETEPGTTTGGLTLEQMQNMDWDSLSSAQQYQLQQAGMGPMDAPAVTPPSEDTPNPTGPATTTTLPPLSPEQVEQLLAIDPAELTDIERQQLEAAGQDIPEAEPVGFRSPAIRDPNAPEPSGPYVPGPGETFQDGVWTDFDGNVIGYAETEDSPLRTGPRWWGQDANNGLPDNYYDLQNYYGPGGALKASASNRLAEGVKNAIAARESRAYNSGQRGMPVENGLFPPALLAQMEANMGRNMASSSLQHNMDLYGGKNGPTNPYDVANGPPIDISEMMGARQGTGTPEPEPGTPEWWAANSTPPQEQNPMDIFDQLLGSGGGSSEPTVPGTPYSPGEYVANMKPHPDQFAVQNGSMTVPDNSAPIYPPFNMQDHLPWQGIPPQLTAQGGVVSDPMSQINATVPDAVTEVLDQSQGGQPVIPTGGLASITDAMEQFPANLQAAIQRAIQSAGQTVSTTTGIPDTLEQQWHDAGEGDPAITPGTLTDWYQGTTTAPNEVPGRPDVLRPDILELMHSQEQLRRQSDADATGQSMSERETIPGQYWQAHDMSPEEIANLRMQQLWVNRLIPALQGGAPFIQAVPYLNRIITTAAESQGINDTSTSHDDAAAALTGNVLPAGDATSLDQLDVIPGEDTYYGDDGEPLGLRGGGNGSRMDIAAFLDADRNRQAALSGKAYNAAPKTGGGYSKRSGGSQKKTTQNLASDRLKKIATAVGRTKVLGGVR